MVLPVHFQKKIFSTDEYQFEFILKLHGQNSVNGSLFRFRSSLHYFKCNLNRTRGGGGGGGQMLP